ncbi:SAGA complex subunit Sgf73 [Saitoella coloradoensis]
MDVTGPEFTRLLPFIISSINESNFVAIDCEFSGIRSWNSGGKSKAKGGGKQTLQERYTETKEAAEKYEVIQLGLCCVRWDGLAGEYVAKPYNFSVSPIQPQRMGLDRQFVMQASAIEFLIGNGFDFNKQYREGVKYLSHADESIVRAKFAESSPDKIPPIHVDARGQVFLDRLASDVKDWLSPTLHPNELPKYHFLNIDTGPNAYFKRLTYQWLRQEYPELQASSRHDWIQITQTNKAAIERKDAERTARFESELEEAIGLRRVVEALAKSGKPIVGHNLYMDLVNVWGKFIGPLPQEVGEFVEGVNGLFPIVFDTKYFATRSDPDITKVFPETHLQALAKWADSIPEPPLRTESDFRRYAAYNQTFAHEAGYDALDTAKVFLKLSYLLAPRSPLPSVPATRPISQQSEEDEEHLFRPRNTVNNAVNTVSAVTNKFAALLSAAADSEPEEKEKPILGWEDKKWRNLIGNLTVGGTETGYMALKGLQTDGMNGELANMQQTNGQAVSPSAVLMSSAVQEFFRESGASKAPAIGVRGITAPSSNGQSWQQFAADVEAEHGTSPMASSETAKSPITSELDSRQYKVFGSRPLQDAADYVSCKHCGKPVMRSAVTDHLNVCLAIVPAKPVHTSPAKRAEKKPALPPRSVADDLASDKGTPTKNEKKRKAGEMTDVTNLGASTSKKPAKTTDKQAEKERKKKEKQAKKTAVPPKPKEKGPVNVELQCGVPLPQGGQCARSLTCKSHSMGAKRSVPGRSAPYDILLAAYQKKNAAKQQKMLPPPAPERDEFELSAGAQPQDSDEEVAMVMDGVGRSYARPLERRVITSARSRNMFFRVREGMASALGGGRMNMQNMGAPGFASRVLPFPVQGGPQGGS